MAVAMDRTRVPALAIKTDNNAAPKTRRRLQKSGSRQRQQSQQRGSVECPRESIENKPHTATKALTLSNPPTSQTSPTANAVAAITSTVVAAVATDPRPSIPLPPNLSDSKWLEYIKKSGFLCTHEPPLQSRHALPIPVANASAAFRPAAAAATTRGEGAELVATSITRKGIPEFSHLAAKPKPLAMERTSTDSERSAKSTSTARRRAKTPVFAIGQLEQMEQRRLSGNIGGKLVEAVEAFRGDGHNSAEVMADEYRSLLESRESFFTDSHSEPPPSRQEQNDGREMRRQHSSGDIRRLSLKQEHNPMPHNNVITSTSSQSPPSSPQDGDEAFSPNSDDGTLVSFEEETIYFKPMSFSPEPTSPLNINNYHHQPPAPPLPPLTPASPPPDNLSLQICLDLLTRELSSGLSERPYRQSQDTSALQVWVMIEAYERLKSTVVDMPLTPEQARPMHAMFDTWLRALYTIHDSMTGDLLPRPAKQGGDEYDGLEESLD